MLDHWLLLVIVGVIGALCNRMRGGGLVNLADMYPNLWLNRFDTSILKTVGKHGNDILFGLLCAILLSYEYVGFVDGTPNYVLSSFNILIVFITSISMWLGRSFGWGSYIGGIIRRSITPELEISFIDKLVFANSNYPVLRNVAALSMRGLIWTIFIVLGFVITNFTTDIIVPVSNLFLLLLSGVLMGPTYLAAVEIANRVLGLPRANGWWLGEYIWGVILWSTVGYSLVCCNA